MLEKRSEKKNAIIDTGEWFTENDLSLPVISGNYDEINRNGMALADDIDYYRWKTELGALSFYDDTYIYGVSQNDNMQKIYLTMYDRNSGSHVATLDFSEVCGLKDRDIRWAQYRDGILYVSIWNNGYAEPDSSYIMAIEMESMEVVWKSESQVSNATNFILLGDVIVCAYGFTAEPDYLYQLDIYTGSIVDQTPLQSMADYLVYKNDAFSEKLYVRCYDTDYVFEILAETDEKSDENKDWVTENYASGEIQPDVYEKECAVNDGTIQYRMVVADAALGNRFFVLFKSTDSGKSWNMESKDPFHGDMGNSVDFTFLDEQLGFAVLSHNGQENAALYRTEDGGKNFSCVMLEDYSVTLDNGYTYNPFDYPGLPYIEEGRLYMLCGQGADGDYYGGDDAVGMLYESTDDGRSFACLGVKYIND